MEKRKPVSGFRSESEIEVKTEDKVKESMNVRGICAAIQAMNFPTFDSLNKMLKEFGYKLVKL